MCRTPGKTRGKRPSCIHTRQNQIWQPRAREAKRAVLSRFNPVQLFATLWTVGSPPGSSVHVILQARILEWVAMPSSRGSSWPRDWTCISCGSLHPGRWILYHWATWEAQGEASLSLFSPGLYLFALLAGSHNTPCFVGAPHSHGRGGGFLWGPSECQKAKDVAPTLFLCLECPTITSSFPGTIISCRMWRCVFWGLLQHCPATAERWFW